MGVLFLSVSAGDAAAFDEAPRVTAPCGLALNFPDSPNFLRVSPKLAPIWETPPRPQGLDRYPSDLLRAGRDA
jgi:hypothetical protein